jgi:uncharacterized protein YbbK (DUF523 family)
MEEERRMEEVEYGLPVPREAMRLVGNPETPRLITNRTGIDHTDCMLKWAVNKAGEGETLRFSFQKQVAELRYAKRKGIC